MAVESSVAGDPLSERELPSRGQGQDRGRRGRRGLAGRVAGGRRPAVRGRAGAARADHPHPPRGPARLPGRHPERAGLPAMDRAGGLAGGQLGGRIPRGVEPGGGRAGRDPHPQQPVLWLAARDPDRDAPASAPDLRRRLDRLCGRIRRSAMRAISATRWWSRPMPARPRPAPRMPARSRPWRCSPPSARSTRSSRASPRGGSDRRPRTRARS